MHVRNLLMAILLVMGACQGSLQVQLTASSETDGVVLSSEDSGNGGSTGTTIIEDSDSTSESTGSTTKESASTSSETSTSEDLSTTDGEIETTGQMPVECLFEAQHLPCDGASDDPFHALGLNCSDLGDKWIDGLNATALNNVDFQAPEALGESRAWQVAKSYGNYINPDTQLPFWSPQEGQTMLMLSNGLLPTKDDDGAIIMKEADYFHDIGMGQPWDAGNWPSPVTEVAASNEPFVDCDGFGDCSGSLAKLGIVSGDAKDKVWLHFKVVVPEGAHGFHFNMAYFSAHWPAFKASSYVDSVIVWQESEVYSGNIAVNQDGEALSINSMQMDYQASCPKDDPDCKLTPAELEGTSFTIDGGATQWFQIHGGGLVPGETLTLTIMSMDLWDSVYNSVALLDGWQWDCEGCNPNVVGGCGIKKID